MKWFIYVAIAVIILVVFGLVYAISAYMNKRKQPKYKTTAPDDDPKFLRDLAERLKNEDKKPESKTDNDPLEGDPPGDK